MNSTSETPLVRADYNIPTHLANVRVHGGHRSNPSEYWIKFTGRDGSIFELFPSEIREIIERFRFSGTPLDRLRAAYNWANRSSEYRLSWLAEGELHV